MSMDAKDGAGIVEAGPLPDDLAALVRVSAELARGVDGAVEEALVAATVAADPVEVEETILQSYLFLGYPAALNGFAVWRRVSGLPSPSGPEATGEFDPEWESRGERVCGAVYGGQYPRLRRNIRSLRTEMERWMVTEGYGKVIGRPGLDLARRECCISAILAVQGVERQLYSHLRGALQVGARPEVVHAALELALESARPDRAERARKTWARVVDRGPATEASDRVR